MPALTPEAKQLLSSTIRALRERLLRDIPVKEVAATLIYRLVFVRHLEALGLSRPMVLTGGWSGKGYQARLDALFNELSIDLPGLFGGAGLTGLLPIPAATLREVVERLDDPKLASAWTDDTTLGWVYQYWNDPDREALDAKIKAGGKIEPYEIASKTQMFTERYMVEWLLQNSVGLTWLCICKKNGWKADAEALLPALEARRAEWRAKREAGEVALDALMPIEGELEEQWKYYVVQPIPEDAIQRAPASMQDLKILDPACGSGHFLVIAFDLLAALYREEARHRGQVVSAGEIAASILENNLHGIDIDPRAIHIAAAALYTKARALGKDVRPKRVNLVAPALKFANLPKDDPALIAEETDGIVKSLEGVDHLGSLWRVDDAVAQWKEGTLEKLERFLGKYSRADDLGLRPLAEQYTAGVRFVRMIREGSYDVVVGNPPYQSSSRIADAGYVTKHYPRGKADLYAAFLERGLQLTREGGLCALLTMRGWMFLGQFAELRHSVLHDHTVCALGDVDRGAFEDVPDEVLSTTMSVLRRSKPIGLPSVAVQPTPPEDQSRDSGRTARKRAALLLQVGRCSFDQRAFSVIEGEAIVYWWSASELESYGAAPKLGDRMDVRAGMQTSNNARYLRKAYEVGSSHVLKIRDGSYTETDLAWSPYIKGAAGAEWFEPADDLVLWTSHGLEKRVMYDAFGAKGGGNGTPSRSFYFRRGIAFSMIGSSFRARAHKYPSIIGDKGASVFPASIPDVLALMNSTRARQILSSLNPSVSFQVGDVCRLPLFRVERAGEIFCIIERAFGEHESTREPSIEFKRPGPSPWVYAQSWAQAAVDRPEGAPLPPYEPRYEDASPEAYLSFALGVALGRFGAHGEGILDAAPDTALPHGILFLSAAAPDRDGLAHPACGGLHEAYAKYGAARNDYEDLGDYLRRGFFLAYHRPVYENRPIYFPLSSARKNFVAWISIHRWKHETLKILLVDHLLPERQRLENAFKEKAEKRCADAQRLLEELDDFIAKTTEIAERGPDGREADAPYVMDLDDGVMVNASALWPLLEPQWNDPKKWWKELVTAEGRKDYDWSRLAARYFPSRVEKKCALDPSLAVAHQCFWRLFPAKAHAWELRLQGEIGSHFKINEPGSEEARQRFVESRKSGADSERVPLEPPGNRESTRMRSKRNAHRRKGGFR